MGKILIVDDQPAICEFLSNLFSSHALYEYKKKLFKERRISSFIKSWKKLSAEPRYLKNDYYRREVFFMREKFFIFMVVFLLVLPIVSWAADTKGGEKTMFGEMKKLIPSDRIKTTDDLYQKWQDVQAGKSKAIIIDLRTESEFESGHIKDSNNIDSGHAYSIPDKWPDPETEMWVFCRTQHRATYFVGSLYKYGYKNVYLVDKGIVGWSEKGYPLVNTYLGEIKVVKYDKKLKENFSYRENK